MKINSKRYNKLVEVLEYVFSDISKNIGGTFNISLFRANVCLRYSINAHLHYYSNDKYENDTLVIYVARMLMQKGDVFIWGVSLDVCINELYNNTAFRKYKV